MLYDHNLRRPCRFRSSFLPFSRFPRPSDFSYLPALFHPFHLLSALLRFLAPASRPRLAEACLTSWHSPLGTSHASHRAHFMYSTKGCIRSHFFGTCILCTRLLPPSARLLLPHIRPTPLLYFYSLSSLAHYYFFLLVSAASVE